MCKKIAGTELKIPAEGSGPKTRDIRRSRRVFAGFTLVEIVIVVVILAIASALMIPMLSSAGSMQLGSAANIIAADLEYAKSMAITKGQNFTVDFDEANESYRIKDQSGGVIKHPVKKGFDYIVSFRDDSRLSRVDIVDVDFDSQSKVTFNYLGSPVNDNGGFIRLGADGVGMKVNVEPVTGFISIEEI